ncbi:type VI secretion system baseplate subunit TssK [Sodalis ligni]|uniref:Type VI secretion system protein ImpJ n=1 Tax=Sodalis ligni TaxID=2697027 RepID=A0A4R1NDX7_9GAMM|nr:type VI secretion system baseplate subunit TssK [Sodalis ligni]TCL05603.1 type VI secretion system protein ImpJ [Sodalis ligni]
MKIYRPLWIEGAFLAPQQFQQQARWEAFHRSCLDRLSVRYPWGVLSARFDTDALRLNRLKAEYLHVRMADGSLIDTDRCDTLPPPCDIAQVLPADVRRVEVLLALPLEHANGGNCRRQEEEKGHPVRYRQEWAEVQDVLGNESESIAVERYELSLRFDFDKNGEYLTCPVARLLRDGRGNWELDRQFIPPLLSFGAGDEMYRALGLLMGQLQAKRRRLMGMRRESNQRMADFAVADVSLFWLLNALNSSEPVLADLLRDPAVHPELLYRELIKLAGALLTFSLDQDIDAIPPYDHERLETVFPPLFGLIGTLLEASLPSRVLTLVLESIGPNYWKAPLNDVRLREEADFYLSVRSSVPAHRLQSQFPALCKIGAPDDVHELVNTALNGVPLVCLSQVPAAIPLRFENQYFAMDLSHSAAQAMLAAGCCYLYVPGSLPDIQLELFAVLRA